MSRKTASCGYSVQRVFVIWCKSRNCQSCFFGNLTNRLKLHNFQAFWSTRFGTNYLLISKRLCISPPIQHICKIFIGKGPQPCQNLYRLERSMYLKRKILASSHMVKIDQKYFPKGVLKMPSHDTLTDGNVSKSAEPILKWSKLGEPNKNNFEGVTRG